MKTFEEIHREGDYDLSRWLNNAEKYRAHKKAGPSENSGMIYESLGQHIGLTLRYFVRIISQNGIEEIINSLIVDILKQHNIYSDKNAGFFKSLIFNVIFFHDFGKINDLFQKKKMDNPNIRLNRSKDANHSDLGATFYELYHIGLIRRGYSKGSAVVFQILAAIFANIIRQHHGNIEVKSRAAKEMDRESENIREFNDIFILNRDAELYFDEFTEIFSVSISIDEAEKNRSDFSKLFEKLQARDSLFFLLKLSFSLLTAADYLATNEFMTGEAVDDFGVIDREFIDHLTSRTHSIHYNRKMLDNIDELRERDTSGLERSNKNLNILRCKLAAEVVSRIRQNPDQRLFYIEAPTGAGKTNLSALAACEILNCRSDIKHIYYVFPFINLITQTKEFFSKELGVPADKMTELHSRASDDRGGEDYKGEWRDYLNHLFVNYPLVFLTHVKFFDALKTNKKTANYLMHSLSNSIVIIDELQSYPAVHWDKVNYLLGEYARRFNITFIVMSATLPYIGQLDIITEKDNFVKLVDDKSVYFNNSNFKDRVDIIFELFDKQIDSEYSVLIDKIFNESEARYKAEGKVRTVVEFITKRRAREFFDIAINDDRFRDYQVVLLTGTLLEPRRKEIIREIKSGRVGEKYLLVATQVIEAGVDIDMDIGFKDKASPDFDEQLAGRINRNASKNGCRLFIFNTGDEDTVYKKDLRFTNNQEIRGMDVYRNTLAKKDFKGFYDKVCELIINNNDNPYMDGTARSYKCDIERLDFEDIDRKFRLIENESMSVYVPLDIPSGAFADSELEFLKSINPEIIIDGEVRGEAVFDAYIEALTGQPMGSNNEFRARTLTKRRFGSIISQFLFSVSANPYSLRELAAIASLKEKHGYLYMEAWQEIYSYENGMENLKDIEKECMML
ncbi:MAG: CRISPR-associated helicase Cas3' [Candidatus Kapaibacterium sp.]